jgi:hypothetical protein
MSTDRSFGLQKLGGVAAIGAAGAFVFGFAFLVTVLSDYATEDPEPAEAVSFLVDNRLALYVWNVVIFLAFGVALVPIVLALHQRIRAKQPALAQVGAVFGLIWAGLVLAAGMIANVALGTIADLQDMNAEVALPTWAAVDTVQDGLGGGVELVGGLWVLLVSIGGLVTASLPRALGRLGVIAGAAGVATVFPTLEAAGAAFGLALIVWFAWTGVHLVRTSRDAGAIRPTAPFTPAGRAS